MKVIAGYEFLRSFKLIENPNNFHKMKKSYTKRIL